MGPSSGAVPIQGIDYGALAGAQQSNPWLALSQALASYPQQQQQKLQDQQDRQYLLAQRKAQQTEEDQKQAQNQIGMLKPMLLADSKKAHDLQYVQAIKQAYEKLGIPAPLTQDGQSIDLDQFKKPWEDIDSKTQLQIMQMPTEQRNAILKQYSGVPDEVKNAQQYVTTKDQAAFARIQQAGLKQEETNSLQQERVGLLRDMDKAKEDYDYTKISSIQQDASVKTEKVALMAEQLREMPMKLQQQQQRLNGYLQHLKTASKSGGSAAFTYQKLLNSEARNATTLYNEAEAKYNEALKAQAAVMGTVADLDDPRIKSAGDLVIQTKKEMDDLRASSNNAKNFLEGESAALATGASVTATSGNPTTVITKQSSNSKALGKAPAGLAPGTYEVRGQKVEVRADGNYYAL